MIEWVRGDGGPWQPHFCLFDQNLGLDPPSSQHAVTMDLLQAVNNEIGDVTKPHAYL